MIKELLLKNKIEKIAGKEQVQFDVSMAPHCSFRCGGRARALILVKEEAVLKQLLALLQSEKQPYVILGNGSNVLFTDGGYDGFVLKLQNDEISIEGNRVTCGAAALLSAASKQAAEAGLSGLEFACGIPGSLGGAVYMNAGAYDHDLSQVLTSVRCMHQDGSIEELPADRLALSYRYSVFMETHDVVLSVTMTLTPGDRAAISQQMAEYTHLRTTKQPLAFPSAGSFFKRPQGHFAGKLIEDAGLKGLRVGGAQVSDLHAGFVINADKATTSDVIDLMKLVQETVLTKFDVLLEPEVQILGK